MPMKVSDQRRLQEPSGFSHPARMMATTAIAPVQCQPGASVALPEAGAPEGYAFLGWVTQTYETVSALPDVLTGSYAPTADITLYALYAHIETEDASIFKQKIEVFRAYWEDLMRKEKESNATRIAELKAELAKLEGRA